MTGASNEQRAYFYLQRLIIGHSVDVEGIQRAARLPTWPAAQAALDRAVLEGWMRQEGRSKWYKKTGLSAAERSYRGGPERENLTRYQCLRCGTAWDSGRLSVNDDDVCDACGSGETRVLQGLAGDDTYADPEEQYTMKEFVTAHGITSQAVYQGRVPGFPGDTTSRHPVDKWQVTIRFGGRDTMVIPYYMGMGHHGNPPTTEDVLDNLASDASSREASRDAKDFASEMGFDWSDRNDRLRAVRIFQQIERQSARLKQALGQEAYDHLLYQTERL